MHLLGQSIEFAGIGIGIFLLIVLGIAYFVPTVVALIRSHHNLGAIIALNVLLGWTVVGWIAAFVWSLTSPPKNPA